MWELARTLETVSSTQSSAGVTAGDPAGGADLPPVAAPAGVAAAGGCAGGEIEDEAGAHRTSKLCTETEASPMMACRGSIPEHGTGGAGVLPLEISEALFKFASVHCPGADEGTAVRDHSAPRIKGTWNFRETVVGGPILITILSAHSPRSPLSRRRRAARLGPCRQFEAAPRSYPAYPIFKTSTFSVPPKKKKFTRFPGSRLPSLARPPGTQHTFTPEQETRTKKRTMGEPVIGSLICGSVALVMMIWNWRMVEHQKWLLRRCGKEAAMKARARAELRAEARAQVAVPSACAEEETRVSAEAPSKSPACPSSRYVVKLESLPEWNESSPDMMFFKTRDRSETAPMSPALSSTRSRSGTGCFFTDG